MKMVHGKQSALARIAALMLAMCLLVTGLPVSAAATAQQTTNYVNLQASTVTYKNGQTLLQTDDFTITTKSLTTRDNGCLMLELVIKNTGKQELTFQSASAEIEGYNVSMAIYDTLRPNTQKTISIMIDALPLSAVGVELMRNMNITFDVAGKSFSDLVYENCRITVPLGVPIAMEYYAYEKCIYEEEGFKLTLLGGMKVKERATPPYLIFRLDNKLDGPVMARNDGSLVVNRNECGFYIHETAAAYSTAVFAVTSYDDFFEGTAMNVAYMDFPVQICTGNLNPLVDTKLSVRIRDDGKILSCNVSSAKNAGYGKYIKEYHANSNLFMGMFHNYKPDDQYIASLKNKYPETLERYYNGKINLHVNELLTLYLAKLAENGYNFGVVERHDLCNESSYVVELTDNGVYAIQVAFTIAEHDPKYPWIMTLGCSTEDYQNLDKLNHYLAAIWLAYETLNVRMTEEKYDRMLLECESIRDTPYGLMQRGQVDGLGYVTAYGDDFYLMITPDFTFPLLQGVKQTGTQNDLNVGDTFTFGSYEQDNVTSNGAEPIEWVVLDKKDGKALAVSVQALDSKRYHNYSAKINWWTCSLRKWMNGDFYKAAFTDGEKAKICPTEVEPYAGTDNVFLLSEAEVQAYFPDAEDRLCGASAYAAAHGAYVNYKTDCGWWLLRTVGRGGRDRVMSVNSDGTMDTKGGKVESDKGMVRPAIWIDLSK